MNYVDIDEILVLILLGKPFEKVSGRDIWLQTALEETHKFLPDPVLNYKFFMLITADIC